MREEMIKTSDFDFELPDSQIAQKPEEKRENSKMLHLLRQKKVFKDKHFFNIVDVLSEEDILVLNDTKVIQARIFGKKSETGASIEIFLLKLLCANENTWECLIRPSKRVKVGTRICVSDDFYIEVLEKNLECGKCLVKLEFDANFEDLLSKYGTMPLPPYIERKMQDFDLKNLDRSRYQTVFAKHAGSVAAPTAGLHFSEDILKQLEKKGVNICYITLDVGLGTFRPVKVENVIDHKMDYESFSVPEETAMIINEGKKRGKNIVACGTTTVRTLESVFLKHNKIVPCRDKSDLFILEPFKFNVVDKLITNFHLPKSTLLMLVCAFCHDKDFVFKAYRHAILNNYRFYSYGDCMFIE